MIQDIFSHKIFFILTKSINLNIILIYPYGYKQIKSEEGRKIDSLIGLFKTLSDENRLRLMLLLAKQDLCVCQMCGVLDLPQPRISKHLAKLRDKNFVIDDRREQYVFYSINKEDKVLMSIIEDILKNINLYPQLKTDHDRLKDIDKYLSACNIEDMKRLI